MFPDRSTWVGALAAALSIALAVCWLHPEVALQGKVYTSSDAQAAAAFQTVGDEMLARGEFPHWNPFVFTGMPSYASLAYNPHTYPLSEPIKLARETFGLVPMTWMLVHVWIAGLGLAFWLRWRGASWATASVAGALLVAVPQIVSWGAYGHGTKLGTFAWMPWALWFTEATLRRGGVGWAAALAATVALMLLRAHVQIAYYAVMAIAALVLAEWIAAVRNGGMRRRVVGRTGWIVLAGVVGLGAALVLYLPVLEYQAHSIRGAGSQGGGAAFDYATSWSLGWPELPTFWWPTAAGYGRGSYVGGMPFTDFPNYLGLPLLAFAGCGVLMRRDRTTWTLFALAVFTTLVALGKNFFLYQVLYDLLPGFKKFRVPVMILAVQQLVVLVLAARGLDAVIARVRDRERALGVAFSRVALVAAVTAGLFAMLLGTIGISSLGQTLLQRWTAMAASFGRPAPPIEAMAAAVDLAAADAVRIGAVIAAIVLALAAARRFPRASAMVVPVIGLLLFVDLWRVNEPMIHPERYLPRLAVEGNRYVALPSESIVEEATALRAYTADAELKRWLREQEDRPRVFPLGSYASDNRLAAQGIVSLGGYHAAKLAVYERMRERMFDPQRPDFRLVNLLAARWVVTDRPLAEQTLDAVRQLGSDLGSEPVLVTGEGTVYENRSALPRAWIVEDVELERPGADTTALEPEVAVLGRVLADGFDPGRQAILSGRPDPLPQPGAASGSVQMVEEGYNRMRLRVLLPAAGVLVVPDIWYPQWRARVNGETVPLLRANFALRAVALPAGEHEVEFVYAADAYRTGRTVASLSTLLIVLGLVWAPFRRWQQVRRGTAHRSEASDA